MVAPRPDTFKAKLAQMGNRLDRLEKAVAKRRSARVYPTTERPDPAEAGVGAQIYDRTLHRPLWSDGAAWRDAVGNVV